MMRVLHLLPLFLTLPALASVLACGRPVTTPGSPSAEADPLPPADAAPDPTPAPAAPLVETFRVPPLTTSGEGGEGGENAPDDAPPAPPLDYVELDGASLPAPVSPPLPLRVFLDFRGGAFASATWSEANARDATSPLLAPDTVELPPMTGQPWGLPAASLVDQMIGYLLQDFARWDVTFVTFRPADGDYTRVVLGGAPTDLGMDPGLPGFAPLDPDDRNPNDVVFVFTQALGAEGASVRELATQVAHGLAHSLGLEHIDRADDVMAAAPCASCTPDWGAGDGLGAAMWQDDVELLDEVLPLAGTATPPPEPPPEPPAEPTGPTDCFDDIEDSWAAADVCVIAELGITQGCAVDLFCPADVVTRDQMAVFLDRLYQAATDEVPDAAAPPFVDVPTTHWAYDAVARLYELGVTNGTDDTHFSPGDPVTRGQMAAFLDRTWQAVVGTSAPAVSTPFVDVTDHFAASSIARLYGLGITQGTDDTHFSPEASVTREQMAAFLARTWASLP